LILFAKRAQGKGSINLPPSSRDNDFSRRRVARYHRLATSTRNRRSACDRSIHVDVHIPRAVGTAFPTVRGGGDKLLLARARLVNEKRHSARHIRALAICIYTPLLSLPAMYDEEI